MNDIPKELFKEWNDKLKLDPCPFCKQDAEFITNKSKQIILTHFPSGVCMARCESYCDSFEQGYDWWIGKRHGKES